MVSGSQTLDADGLRCGQMWRSQQLCTRIFGLSLSVVRLYLLPQRRREGDEGDIQLPNSFGNVTLLSDVQVRVVSSIFLPPEFSGSSSTIQTTF
jgi:hypothetical protein